MNDWQRVLKVGVDENYCVSGRIIQAGGGSYLMAEITRQMNYFNSAVLRGPVHNLFDGFVRAPVIYKDHFRFHGDLTHEFFEFGAKKIDYHFLVVHGNHEG